MKRLWQRYAERIDAASLRERCMVFAAAALVVVALLDNLLIEPQLRERQRLAAEQTAREAGSAKLQAELKRLVLVGRADPDREARAHLAALREEITRLNGQIAEEQRKFTTPQRMGGVLQEILAHNQKLRLVDMKTLPVVALSDAKGQEGAKAAPGIERMIYRHGIEITLSGTYLDMLGYLTALENLPTQMYWGSMDLSVDQYPTATLKLVVYTVSLDRAWMVV